jgi:uncharacterized lipoprotein NlpE involved in copper resistance
MALTTVVFVLSNFVQCPQRISRKNDTKTHTKISKNIPPLSPRNIYIFCFNGMNYGALERQALVKHEHHSNRVYVSPKKQMRS